MDEKTVARMQAELSRAPTLTVVGADGDGDRVVATLTADFNDVCSVLLALELASLLVKAAATATAAGAPTPDGVTLPDLLLRYFSIKRLEAKWGMALRRFARETEKPMPSFRVN